MRVTPLSSMERQTPTTPQLKTPPSVLTAFDKFAVRIEDLDRWSEFPYLRDDRCGISDNDYRHLVRTNVTSCGFLHLI